MIYQPELYYFFDTKGFPLEKAILVTAKAVARYCNGYQSRLIAAKRSVKNKNMMGFLPDNLTEKELMIEKIYQWIKENSDFKDMFALFFYDNYPLIEQRQAAKFDHHDDTCCWSLNLTNKEFIEVQKEWQKNDLPKDLFYPNAQGIQKGSKYYSPKRWGVQEKKQKSPKN